MRPTSCLALLVTASLLGASAAARALTPYQVSQGGGFTPASSSPHDFRPFGRLALFSASDGRTPAAFWRSDGTEAGTVPLVADCGGCTRRPGFFPPVDSGPFSFFATSVLFGEDSLWVTRGRPANTIRLADFPAGLGPAGLARWVPEAGRLYFTAGDAQNGRELWTSDGTAAGTHLVADLEPGPAGSFPASLTPLGGALYFTATVAGSAGLWKTDGTAQGTVEVKATAPAAAPEALPTGLVAFGGRLLFFAPGADLGLALWSSDGTPGGTAPVTTIAPVNDAPELFYAFPVGGRVFFVILTDQEQSLWSTDGTAQNTRRLAGFPFRPETGGNLFIWPVGDRVYFPADDGLHGQELWTSDGTVAGTRLVADLCPGPCSGADVTLASLGNRLLFSGSDGVHGFELWATDGTRKGTAMVKDLCPGSCSSGPYRPQVLGNRILFQGGTELWSTDGTSAGTLRLTAFADPQWLFDGAATPTQILFAGEDAAHGSELWRTDGTLAGTRRVKDIDTVQLGGFSAGDLAAAGDRLYFFHGVRGASGPGSGHSEIWKSDGTAPGTVRVKDFGPGTVSPFSLVTAAVRRRLFFVYDPQSPNGRALWTSDGSAAGTARLTPSGVRVNGELAALGTNVFFVADDGHGLALWKSDGTAPGTRLVDPVGRSGASAQHLTPFAGRLFYFQANSRGNQELWSTDGTAAGTVHVADLNTFFHDDNPPLLASFSGRLYFFAQDPDPLNLAFSSLRLWSTDGTAAGTHRVSDFGLASGDSVFPAQLAVAGGRLFFWISIHSTEELWTSDGTAAGTHRVAPSQILRDPFNQTTPVDVAGRVAFLGPGDDGFSALWVSDGTAAGTGPLLDAQGQPVVEVTALRPFAGRLVFAARSGAKLALWESDGTPAGTRPLLPLADPSTGYGEDLTVAGARLYFTAQTLDTGSQIWALRPD